MNSALEGLTRLLLYIVKIIPVAGPFVQQYLPTDKPDYKSLTVKAGVIWGVLTALCSSLPLAFPETAPVCGKITGGLAVISPILMFLGVRRAAVNAAAQTATPAPTPPKAS